MLHTAAAGGPLDGQIGGVVGGFTGLTPGAPVYYSETAGRYTQSLADLAIDAVVQIFGVALTADRVLKFLQAGKRRSVVPVQLSCGAVAVSQTALNVGRLTLPAGRAATLWGVSVDCDDVTATATVDVKANATTVLNAVITPVDATEVAGVLAGEVDRLAVAAGATLNVLATTNGSGEIADLRVTLWLEMD
jgi:hypothetical protein